MRGGDANDVGREPQARRCAAVRAGAPRDAAHRGFTALGIADTLARLHNKSIDHGIGQSRGGRRAEGRTMAREKFKTKVEAGERGRVFITIPFTPADKWGKKPRHFVKGKINSTEFSGSLGTRGGVHFFPLNKDLQDAAELAPGDAVTVEIEPQDGAASDDLPDDLAKALAKDAKAREFLAGLSAFYRNTYVKWITEAKKPETRASRVEQTVALLKQGKKQR
jgi:hypothetical protein